MPTHHATALDKQTSLRLPVSLFAALEADATASDRSLGYVMRQIISAEYARRAAVAALADGAL